MPRELGAELAQVMIEVEVAPALPLVGGQTTEYRMRLHIAFAVTVKDVVASVGRLRDAGVPPRAHGGGPDIDEPLVFAWMPAASVYFDDPDGNSLEFIAVLPEPARPDLGRVPLSEWMALAYAAPTAT